ncbi:GNAT family N-acetyltransferase [uncultured Piscinibacter sp.]|uniref:GNAT family N-acetyltransferase n=1 Tax=uncultured Piscinibacter sp. TaxID=1131835 RepID=UPI00262401BD|nr:GNAT family N-acetyltransferase [uncultured Piscinibacter sp.]
MSADPTVVRRLRREEVEAHAPELAALVLDAVADGASVGYMADVSVPQAEAWWRAAASADDARAVLVALDAQGIAGVAAVLPSGSAFQPHRAEIAKVIVHRRARGRGLATALMCAAEREALAMGRHALSLTTRRGSEAEHLYRKLGWMRVGLLPYDSLRPDGTPCDAAIYVKQFNPGPVAPNLPSGGRFAGAKVS